ncbi:MAG TPA: hypothetical protein VFI70_13940, partial [Nitrososphaeraceae archaeon]|nr:hypothetical protein [Nitrososphaeraceae archaeon]
TKSDKTHARKLIKQKINLKREIQIMPQSQLINLPLLLISKLYQDATLLLQFEKFFWPKLTLNI